MIWKTSDKQIAILRKTIEAEFHNLSNSLRMDQLNIITVKKAVNTMYKRMDKRNRKSYRRIIEDAWLTVLAQIDDELDMELHTDEILGDVVSAYNATTNYRYESEVERKSSRLIEAILSCKDRQTIREVCARSAKLWFDQSRQYADQCVKFTRIEAFIQAEVGKVRWNTRRDERVCKYCNEKDRMVYRIGSIPHTHYGCRCYLTPVV